MDTAEYAARYEASAKEYQGGKCRDHLHNVTNTILYFNCKKIRSALAHSVIFLSYQKALEQTSGLSDVTREFLEFNSALFVLLLLRYSHPNNILFIMKQVLPSIEASEEILNAHHCNYSIFFEQIRRFLVYFQGELVGASADNKEKFAGHVFRVYMDIDKFLAKEETHTVLRQNTSSARLGYLPSYLSETTKLMLTLFGYLAGSKSCIGYISRQFSPRLYLVERLEDHAEPVPFKVWDFAVRHLFPVDSETGESSRAAAKMDLNRFQGVLNFSRVLYDLDAIKPNDAKINRVLALKHKYPYDFAARLAVPRTKRELLLQYLSIGLSNTVEIWYKMNWPMHGLLMRRLFYIKENFDVFWDKKFIIELFFI